MKNFRIFLILLFIFSCFLTFSCQRISSSDSTGELQTVELTNVTGIPVDYGSLKAVTVPHDRSRWANLWFEDKNSNIRMVRVGIPDNRVHEKVTLIPRY